MKLNYSFPLLTLAVVLAFTSCIKNEAPNAEADIETATIDHASDLLQNEPTITNTSVTFRLKEFSGSYDFAPNFSLTPGATISPESGTKLDFSQPQKYTVHAQDGHWSKTYTVSFIVNDSTNYVYSFENVDTVNTTNPEGHYIDFFDYNKSGQRTKDWSTANEGYNILAATLVPEGETLTPSFYPTYQMADGYEGKAAELQTRSTGSLGSLFGSPLAAGNLFVGTFKLAFPTTNSTRFGQPYNHSNAPMALKGYFKYKAGKDFVVNNAPSGLTKDSWDAYAILFKEQADSNYLMAGHQFDDPRIIAVAHIDASKRIETDQWTLFDIPFKYVAGKSFDPKTHYMYTIVFTSSKEGDQFNGAVGSKLDIDEVQLVTADTK